MAEEAVETPPSPVPRDLNLDLGSFPLSLDNRQLTLLSAGVATLLASQICLHVAQEHVKHWKRPREQRAILLILFMVPFFAVDSYLGLADMPGSEVVITVLDSVRACYEALVVSEFLVLLYSYMDISTAFTAPVPDSVKGKVLHNSFPLTLLLGHEMIVDRRTLNTLYSLSRQFMLVRPLFSVLMCSLLLLGWYHASPLIPWFFVLVFNVSVYLAFYSLILFYHAFEVQLAKHNPLSKFLCIKGVVFLVFWQELLIRLLVSYNVIHAGHMPFQVRQVEEAVQNYVVCIEMFLVSFLFRHAFSATEYETLGAVPEKKEGEQAAKKPTAAAGDKKKLDKQEGEKSGGDESKKEK